MPSIDLPINLPGGQQAAQTLGQIKANIDASTAALNKFRAEAGSAGSAVSSELQQTLRRTSTLTDTLKRQFDDLTRLKDKQDRDDERYHQKSLGRIRQQADEIKRMQETRMRGLANLASGRGGYYGISNLFGGGMTGLGIGVGVEAFKGIFDSLKNLGDNARQLQNLAEEFGITTTEAFKLKAAANLTGMELGNLSQGARRLSDALENPGTTGKKTAEALASMGVSITHGAGPALEGFVQQLGKVTDQTKALSDATQVMGRGGAQWTLLARNVGDVNSAFDELANKRLADARRSLAQLGNDFTVWSGKAAAAVLGVGDKFSKVFLPMQVLLAQTGIIGQTPAAQPTVGPFPGKSFLNFGTANRLLTGDKLGLSDQATQFQDTYKNEAEIVKSLKLQAQSGKAYVSQSELDQHTKAAQAALANYNRVKAEEKAMDKFQSEQERLPDILSRMRDQGAMTGEPNAFRALDLEQEQTLRSVGMVARPGSAAYAQIVGSFDLRRQQALKDLLARNARSAQTSMNEEARANARSGIGMPYRDENGALITGLPFETESRLFEDRLRQGSTDKDRQAQYYKQFLATDTAYQIRSLQSQSGISQRLSGITGIGNDPNSQYQQEIQLAMKIRDIRDDTANKQLEGEERTLELLKNQYDFIEQGDQARIQRQEQLAQMQQQEVDQAKTLTEGIFRAATSGQPFAMSNFLRGYGLNMASKMVGNATQMIFGGSGANFGLGKTGLLGTPQSPSVFGKLFNGITGLGFGASDYGSGNTVPNGGFTGGFGPGASGGGSSSGGGGSFTIDPFGGVAVSGSASNLAPLLSGSTSPMQTISKIANAGPPGSGGSYSGSWSGTQATALGTAAADVGAIRSTVSALGGAGRMASNGNQSNKLGTAMGNFSKGIGLGASGYGLEDLWNQTDWNDPNNTPLTAGQLAGTAASLAGSVAGGTMQAIKGFGSGGARGDLQGVAGIMTAAAPLSGPAAPFLMAGAALTDMIGSVLPDPRQQRIQNMQHTLINQRYIARSPRNYDFSASGGEGSGFSLGMGGAVQSGGQTANYNVTIQTMDAKSFVDWSNSNPAAAAQFMLNGLQSGGSSALLGEIQWNASH